SNGSFNDMFSGYHTKGEISHIRYNMDIQNIIKDVKKRTVIEYCNDSSKSDIFYTDQLDNIDLDYILSNNKLTIINHIPDKSNLLSVLKNEDYIILSSPRDIINIDKMYDIFIIEYYTIFINKLFLSSDMKIIEKFKYILNQANCVIMYDKYNNTSELKFVLELLTNRDVQILKDTCKYEDISFSYIHDIDMLYKICEYCNCYDECL